MDRFVYERDNGTLPSTGSLIWRWVELDDVKRQIVARLTLQPCAVHGHCHVAIVVESFRGGPGDSTTAGRVDVVQLDSNGRIDRVVVGIPSHYAIQY